MLVLFVFTLSLNAQNKASKIGTIDSQELINLMPQYDSIQTVYEREYREMEQAGQQMYADLQRLQDFYVKNVDSMTPFMKSMKKQEIEDLSARIQTFEQNAQQQLQQTIQRLQQPIIDKIKKAIEDVAKENGYSHVIDIASGSLLYHDPNSSIMDLVKKKLGITETISPKVE